MSLWQRLFPTKRPEKKAPAAPAVRPTPPPSPRAKAAMIEWRPGSYPTDIVGESNYQDALLNIAGGHNRAGHEIECQAELRPEPNNPYDSNAVAVFIDGRKVGYLGRDVAADYLTRLAETGAAGATVRCNAKIVGGWRTNQHDSGHFGVRLGLPRRGALTLS